MNDVQTAEWLAARAMTRLNKLRVPSSVSQQRLLREAQDYLAEALDVLQRSDPFDHDRFGGE